LFIFNGLLIVVLVVIWKTGISFAPT